MQLHKPTELLRFLEELGVHPKKALSQNFLLDGNIVRKMVTAADVQPGDSVLEIGPGPGVMTEALLEAGAIVTAVEMDNVFAKALERLQTPDNRLTVVNADVLDFLEHTIPTGKVVANLPYKITTPILAKLVLHPFSRIVVMVQEEVARRFTAVPGTADYSSFTIFLQMYSTPRYAFHVSRNCFYPKPNVESAVVALTPHPALLADPAPFFKVTRRAFEHRRKMLRGSLRDFYTSEKIVQSLAAIGKKPEARPEELSLEEFMAFFKQLSN